MNDFTPFHDEIRRVSPDFLIGKYMTTLPAGVATLLGNSSFGLFHPEEGDRFGFYYTLSRTAQKALPENTLLRPFLDAQLPDGVGMTFDEQMDGWYFSGKSTPEPGRPGDLTMANLIPASGDPAGAASCVFQGRMTIPDVNEFVDGYEHEATIKGSLKFGQFEGVSPAIFTIDEANSRFHYLRLNQATREAEMRYHIEFVNPSGRRYALDGTKYMQKDPGTGAIRDLLGDYTTLYCHVIEKPRRCNARDGHRLSEVPHIRKPGRVRDLAGFLASFQVTGTDNPVYQFQARMRFLGFTAQFVEREYDPLALSAART